MTRIRPPTTVPKQLCAIVVIAMVVARDLREQRCSDVMMEGIAHGVMYGMGLGMVVALHERRRNPDVRWARQVARSLGLSIALTATVVGVSAGGTCFAAHVRGTNDVANAIAGGMLAGALVSLPIRSNRIRVQNVLVCGFFSGVMDQFAPRPSSHSMHAPHALHTSLVSRQSPHLLPHSHALRR